MTNKRWFWSENPKTKLPNHKPTCLQSMFKKDVYFKLLCCCDFIQKIETYYASICHEI